MSKAEVTMDDQDWTTKEEEDDGTFQVDPFMQPPILKAFFEQLSVNELARCRLVSRLWRSESLSAWRSKTALHFGEEGIASTRDDGSYGIDHSIGEFLDLWEEGDWGSCPFRNFFIDGFDFKAEDQQRFLELVGVHVTALRLRMLSFDGREKLQRIIYQAFPNLLFLKIELGSLDDGEETDESEGEILEYKPAKEIPAYKELAFGVHGLKYLDISNCEQFDSMMNILSHFHQLESLHTRELEPRKYRSLLETIRLIRAQDRRKLPLKDFQVEFIFELGKRTAASIELLKLHEQLQLPLQPLQIRFQPEEDMDGKFNNVIRDILQYHSSTLTHLEFIGEDRHELCKSFPFGFNLEKLENLLIRSPRFSDNLNYLRYTPNLHVLCVGSVYEIPTDMSESDNLFSNSSQLEIGDWTLPLLTNLQFYLPLSDCNLGKLMRWMPNVERLWLVLDDGKFSMVSKTWKDLKLLCDCGTELTDEGVIGIENDHEAGGDEESRSCPNITKLKNLTTFMAFSSKLTSASVCDGLLKLANLTRISLSLSAKLDDETITAVKRRGIEFDRPG